VVQRVWIDEAIAVLCQRARDLGRSARAGAVHEAWRPLVGKTMAPRAPRGIGKVQCLRDPLETLAFDDFTHGLGTAKDPRLFRLFQEGISGRESAIGQAQLESPHDRALAYKVLQK
jgi:hypothetical protein